MAVAGDRHSPRRLAVSIGSGSVDQWIVGGEQAPHGQPISRAPDHGIGYPAAAVRSSSSNRCATTSSSPGWMFSGST